MKIKIEWTGRACMSFFKRTRRDKKKSNFIAIFDKFEMNIKTTDRYQTTSVAITHATNLF